MYNCARLDKPHSSDQTCELPMPVKMPPPRNCSGRNVFDAHSCHAAVETATTISALATAPTDTVREKCKSRRPLEITAVATRK